MPNWSKKLEEIRDQFTQGNPDKSIHIIGFAKLIGDLIDGLVRGDGIFRDRGGHCHSSCSTCIPVACVPR